MVRSHSYSRCRSLSQCAPPRSAACSPFGRRRGRPQLPPTRATPTRWLSTFAHRCARWPPSRAHPCLCASLWSLCPPQLSPRSRRAMRSAWRSSALLQRATMCCRCAEAWPPWHSAPTRPAAVEYVRPAYDPGPRVAALHLTPSLYISSESAKWASLRPSARAQPRWWSLRS